MSKNTAPEEKVRKYLFSKGFRYRKNDKKLPGCPDIVLPKYKTVIFVNGCFWHKHDCGRFVWPASNNEYWEKKARQGGYDTYSGNDEPTSKEYVITNNDVDNPTRDVADTFFKIDDDDIQTMDKLFKL